MSQDSMPELVALVGLDWADQHHDVALQVVGGSGIEERRIAHTPEAIHAWLAELEARFAGGRIGVAIETSRGPVISALLESPSLVLYPVNPRSLHRFREAMHPSGAKDDGPDARLLLELLAKHREYLIAWQPEPTTTRLLHRLVEQRRTAIHMRSALIQQLQAALKEYFPQALDWAGVDLMAPMAWDFLTRWPSLGAIQRARSDTVRRFYRQHHCRRMARIEQRVSEIASARPLTRDAAVLESSQLLVQLLVAQLRALKPSIDTLDHAIATCFTSEPDAALFASLPGAGPALAPRLLVAFGTNRDRYPTVDEILKASGIAPVTIRSGRTCRVHWRWGVSTFLRQTFHEFAQHSISHCAWARKYYAALRTRGKSHHVALRALAYKWIRIIWRCWQTHELYDTARYERALLARHSPHALAA